MSKKTFPATDAPSLQKADKGAAKLSKNAQNALLEAQARRVEIDGKAILTKKEKAGRGGLEPTRYNDWEIKGITSDF